MTTRQQTTVRKCPHCGRSFNTDIVDVDRHAERCKRHQAAVLERNLARVRAGQRPTRTGR